MTLIETLVAILLLTVAIVAPMSLASQSLQSAYYARDQVIAYNLAQEAVEAIRSVRDGNALYNALGNVPSKNLLDGIIDTTGKPFIIDTRTLAMSLCNGGAGPCPQMQTDGTFYEYGTGAVTPFTRTITASYVDPPTNNEVRVKVEVKWRTGLFNERTFTMNEDLYRWLNDGAGT